MSRCVMDNEEAGTDVVIGWDPDTSIRPVTFFARVEDCNGREVFWTGGFDQIYDEPDELIARIQPYAGKHDPIKLKRELLKDKRLNSERHYSILDGDDDSDDEQDDWSEQADYICGEHFVFDRSLGVANEHKEKLALTMSGAMQTLKVSFGDPVFMGKPNVASRIIAAEQKRRADGSDYILIRAARPDEEPDW